MNEKNKPYWIQAELETRKSRAGEDWTRHNEILESEYSKESWNQIKSAIIATELVKIMKNKPGANWGDDCLNSPESVPCAEPQISYKLQFGPRTPKKRISSK